MQRHRYIDLTQTRQAPNTYHTRFEADGQTTQSPPVTAIPAHGSYGSLLFDPRWRSRRMEIITRDNARCVICKDEEDLLVHHRQYHFIKAANAFKMPWDYSGHLLITLCKNCHQRGHNKFKIPTLTL